MPGGPCCCIPGGPCHPHTRMLQIRPKNQTDRRSMIGGLIRRSNMLDQPLISASITALEMRAHLHAGRHARRRRHSSAHSRRWAHSCRAAPIHITDLNVKCQLARQVVPGGGMPLPGGPCIPGGGGIPRPIMPANVDSDRQFYLVAT